MKCGYHGMCVADACYAEGACLLSRAQEAQERGRPRVMPTDMRASAEHARRAREAEVERLAARVKRRLA